MEVYLLIIFFILSMFLWVWAITDIAKQKFKTSFLNFVWLLIVIFLPVIGSIGYFLVRKKVIIAKKPRVFSPKFTSRN